MRAKPVSRFDIPREALEAFLAQGLSDDAIGAQLGLSQVSVVRRRQDFGLQPAHPKRPGNLSRDRLVGYLAAGLSAAKIAELVGTSESWVAQQRVRYGLKPAHAPRNRSGVNGSDRVVRGPSVSAADIAFARLLAGRLFADDPRIRPSTGAAPLPSTARPREFSFCGNSSAMCVR